MGLASASTDGAKTNSVVPLKNTKHWLVRNGIPRLIGVSSLFCIVISRLFKGYIFNHEIENRMNQNDALDLTALALDALWVLPGCTLIMLISGPGSPMLVLASLCSGSCVIMSQRYLHLTVLGGHGVLLKDGDQGQTYTTNYDYVRMSDVAVWWILSTLSFFSTGHKSTFGSVHISAAFIGIDDFHFGISGALLAFNTWSGPLLHCFALGTVFPHHDDAEHQRSISSARTMFATCSASMLLFMMLCLMLLRHHLFLWAVFAPKYVFLAATHIIYLTVLSTAEIYDILMNMTYWLVASDKNKHE